MESSLSLAESRQAELVGAVQDASVDLVGLGMHGSWTALALARLEVPRLRLWDGDVVGLENLNTQAYRRADVRRPKHLAMASSIRLSGYRGELISNGRWFPDGHAPFLPLGSVVVSCADSMVVRRNLAVAAHYSGSRLFIESRSAGNELFIHAFKPTTENVNHYLNTCFPARVATTTCGNTGTAALGMQVAALVAGIMLRTRGGELAELFNGDHRVSLGLHHTTRPLHTEPD